ncbi:hypothetical protein [Pontibacter russatus]|uniref:hypothetical protein n=1 Tax=Pontibacter russatus TaxID=2694929 RepID=UPI00137ACC1A|nr:hypothetical protein [Pontibacter russatus]
MSIHLSTLHQLYTGTGSAAETPPGPEKLTLSKENIKKMLWPGLPWHCQKTAEFLGFYFAKQLYF